MGRIGEHVASALLRGEAGSGVAALAGVVPPSLIARVVSSAEELQERERREAGQKPKKRRERKLPGPLSVWLLIGMALYRSLPIKAVLRQIVDGIPGFARFGIAELPHSTSLAEARDRIGKAMQFLFERLATILLEKHMAASRWLGHVVYAIDGACFLVPDEPANDDYFGRPGSSRGGKSGFPQLRSALLITAFTHLVVEATLGPYKTGELTLAQALVPAIPKGAVVLMDRLYYAYAWLASVIARAAFFIVRVKGGKTSLKPRKTKRLGKDDWLATLTAPKALTKERPDLPETLNVRLIKCRIKGFPRILLATNLLDPVKYPAAEVARLYYERWQAELALREIKVYEAAEKAVTFRSHTPERVTQEFYGMLVAYDCVRTLMAEAAQEIGLDPRRLSFKGCLDRVMATIPVFAFASPDRHAEILARLRIDLCQCRLPAKREGRRCRREVKRKMSKWPKKAAGKHRRRRRKARPVVAPKAPPANAQKCRKA